MGSGLFKDIRQTLKTNVKIEARFTPDQKVHTYYQERYARFRSLYESIKDEFDKSAPTASYKVK
jgi:sugar (pentulose or hexulose) kinase